MTPPSAYDGVAYLSTVDGASAVLINPWYVLTAKHATAGWFGNTATFHLSSGTQVFLLEEVFTYPTADIAVVRLNRNTGLTGYPLYDPSVYGSEIGKVGVVAGYGMSGTPATVQAGGDPNYPRGTLRVGYNLIDANAYLFARGTCLQMDFDPPAYGLGADKEVMIALGDSGGPSFIDAGGQLRVAGLHVAIAFYDPNHWPKYGNYGYDGDIGYDVCVSAYAGWIQSVIAATPAPYTGDFNNDTHVNATDVDALFAHYGSADLWYDVSGDGVVGRADSDTLIRTLLGCQYGDVNLDHHIDGGDLALLAANWAVYSGMGWGNGDFNGDKAVDGGDLAIMGTYWNWSAPSPPASEGADIPEPGTLTLLALGALGLIPRRRQARPSARL